MHYSPNTDGKYILDEDKNPIAVDDLFEWGEWFQSEDANRLRRLNLTDVGPYTVSTIFLGLDHNFSGEGEPILWETMVFENESSTHEISPGRTIKVRKSIDSFARRYFTKIGALAGHAEVVKEVEDSIK